MTTPDYDESTIITAAEVTHVFGLSPAAVRNAINRDLNCSRFPSAYKSGGTWLLSWGDALREWGYRLGPSDV